MNRIRVTAILLAGAAACLGCWCHEGGHSAPVERRPHGQIKKGEVAEAANPTRAEALAQIVKLGGVTVPPAPGPGDRVVFVSLRSTGARNADLGAIRALTELGILDLSGTKVTDTGLKQLSALQNLSALTLDGTAVTGEGLAHLAGLPHLSHLGLTGTRVHESDLARLKGMESLLGAVPFPDQAVKAWLIDEDLHSTAWTTSKDASLSLRLLTPKVHYAPSETIVLLAELRNDSPKDWLVLRPFGDDWRVMVWLLKGRGPKGPVQYDRSQGILEYQLGSSAFSLVPHGQVIRDRLDLPVSRFCRLDLEGEYSFKFWYLVDHDARLATLYFPDHKLWTGAIYSKELKITKSQK